MQFDKDKFTKSIDGLPTSSLMVLVWLICLGVFLFSSVWLIGYLFTSILTLIGFVAVMPLVAIAMIAKHLGSHGHGEIDDSVEDIADEYLDQDDDDAEQEVTA